MRMLFNHQKRCHGQGCMRKNTLNIGGSNVIFNGEYIYIYGYIMVIGIFNGEIIYRDIYAVITN